VRSLLRSRQRPRPAYFCLQQVVKLFRAALRASPGRKGCRVAGRAADVPRRELTEEEVAEIVRREVDELDAGITVAERYGRAERAGELRAGRAVLAAYTEV
jgi:hypothetical protein